MGRMIDADALMENYNLKDATKYVNRDAEQQAHSYNTLMMYEIADMIEDAPTAFDLEEVVAKLEEESSFFGGKPMGTLQKHFYCEGIKRAIEIVRGDGK